MPIHLYAGNEHAWSGNSLVLPVTTAAEVPRA
jgi:hypothetical protein